jgi:hypothetical protein
MSKAISYYRKTNEEVEAIQEISLQRLPSLIFLAAEVENDRRENDLKIAQAHNMLTKRVHATLPHKDLQLSKKLPR